MTARISLSFKNLWQPIHRWCVAHPCWLLVILTLSALGPFLAKPFNIDDPLFIWIARHIQQHPTDPYGFDINWYGTVSPVWDIVQNPPLTGYYLAVAACLLGWSEFALHTALLPFGLLVVLGTYRLARSYCNHPLLAACVTLFTPVFLVSSTTVMCDMMMLAFWVWAVVFWQEGLARNSFTRVAVSGCLIALAALTKYYGTCLIPLLLAHGFLAKRKPGWWLITLVIPLAALAAYQITTTHLYGHGLLVDAGAYATDVRKGFGFSDTTIVLTALTFTGGCLATVAFFSPLIWSRRMFLTVIGCGVLIALIALTGGEMPIKYNFWKIQNLRFFELQVGLWMVGGICILALVFTDGLKRWDAASWLLALWIGGTFLFAAFFNWTVSGRTILPMAPVAGILLGRRLDVISGREKNPPGYVFVCLTAGILLSTWVTRADFLQAGAVRLSAWQTHAKFGGGPARLSFEGHWGFQYYMESLGHLPVDLKDADIMPGDYLAVPLNNTNAREPDGKNFENIDVLAFPVVAGITTWNEAGGSFYASVQSPLPFAFGPAQPEGVAVYRLNPAKADVASPPPATGKQ